MDNMKKIKDCSSHDWIYGISDFRICVVCHKFEPPEMRLGKFIPEEWQTDK